ncbi:hypothetical protein PAPYR_7155 [Paratrimastix pyriformis]|uniref:Uncharacterized protein n=1 Tax=Paratrimastix pyriformis TaxID=342808 RepID=A0ABQ8UDL4_9EUKA|nr:hypothetical protein PAPYR_7155 [Paratrimastix pyriformis]
MQVFLTKRCFLLFWYSPILGQYLPKRIELKQIELCRRLKCGRGNVDSIFSAPLGFAELIARDQVELSLFSPPKTPKVRAEPHFPWSIIRRTAHFYYIWAPTFLDSTEITNTTTKVRSSFLQSNSRNHSMETQVENMHIAAADPVVRADPIVPADAATTLDNFGYDFNFDAFVGAVNTVDSTLIGAKITLKKLTDRATCPSSVCDAVNLFSLRLNSPTFPDVRVSELGLKSLTDLCKAAAEMDNEAYATPAGPSRA